MSTGDYVFPYVFVLGRPGSGKSELYTQAAKILSERKKDYIRLDDVRELRKLIVSDKEHKFVKPTADGSFTVVNPSVFDVVLKTVHQQALEHRGQDKIVFIEFARSNYVHSLFENFSEEVLKNSLIVYLHAPLTVSLERTRRRWIEKLRSESMDHMVPGKVLEEFYRVDDHDGLLKSVQWKSVFVDNAVDNIERFKNDIQRIIEIVTTDAGRDPNFVNLFPHPCCKDSAATTTDVATLRNKVHGAIAEDSPIAAIRHLSLSGTCNQTDKPAHAASNEPNAHKKHDHGHGHDP